MTPMNNADYLTRLEHADELEALKAAKKASGLTYEQLAELIGVNKVWLASVFEGQQYVPEEYTLKLAEALKISPSATAFLTPHFLFSIEICFSGKTFPAHALFFTVCPDQSADRLHTDRHCCLRVMNDRIIHAEGIALLISHDKKIRTTADFQMRSHNKQCR